ncbi:hypothetical protein BRADI_5g19033v3 [Brachypodium distachyon]|uniref:Uncharacterized protein n=1 Tax=Brachypodium distachyon TaxID=15368 RepID=A0A2K2CI35_BRADI|nr:hypothetical protein BRADI_5g19033v3 [Brachypodium distachyon]
MVGEYARTKCFIHISPRNNMQLVGFLHGIIPYDILTEVPQRACWFKRMCYQIPRIYCFHMPRFVLETI